MRKRITYISISLIFKVLFKFNFSIHQISKVYHNLWNPPRSTFVKLETFIFFLRLWRVRLFFLTQKILNAKFYFQMFVRLFVDENLDRHVPISKQPKEKIQAIIDSCTRQFPEYASRARKRIRTYLKSCRRTKRSREQAGLDGSNVSLGLIIYKQSSITSFLFT